MKAILTTDGSIRIILSSDESSVDTNFKEKFLSKEIAPSKDSLASSSISVKSSQAPIDLKKPLNILHDESEDDDQYSEYKQTPRQVFMSTICHVRRRTFAISNILSFCIWLQVCKVNLSRPFLCNGCKMISYCKEDHLKMDYLNHKALCLAIQLIAKRRGWLSNF